MKIEVYDYNGLRSHAFIGDVIFSLEPQRGFTRPRGGNENGVD